MSEQPEEQAKGTGRDGQPGEAGEQEAVHAERPKYTPPSYVPPVSLDKDRANPTEPIPSNPTQPLPPGAPPRPEQPQWPAASPGQPAVPQGNAPYGTRAPHGPGAAGAPFGAAPSAYPGAGYPQAYPGAGYPGAQAYPGAQGYGQQPYYYAQEPRGLSIASMVCGISVFIGFGFFVLPQIAAVILGHMALSREPAGRGMALAGLILGYVGIALTVAFLVFFVFVLSVAQSRYSY
jgi:hypothetical protein